MQTLEWLHFLTYWGKACFIAIGSSSGEQVLIDSFSSNGNLQGEGEAAEDICQLVWQGPRGVLLPERAGGWRSNPDGQ